MAFVYDIGNLKKCGSGGRNFWVAKAFALLYSYTVEKSGFTGTHRKEYSDGWGK